MNRHLPGQTFLFAGSAPELRQRALIFDYFAGAGGASTGIEQALGRAPDVAINHCEHAVAVHKLNHPATDHYQVDVWDVDPQRHLPPGDVQMAWFSPDCTHFSKAKGGQPKSQKIRGLAWVVCRVAKARRPRVIFLENVSEFQTWGPLDDEGKPIKEKAGRTFRAFVRRLERLGYAVEHRVLNAADYGAPTTRKRLVLIARCDGQAICWPEPTHGPGRPLPYRTAGECIDWSIPCPSIFTRPRPLVDATCRRLADGIMRYVVNAPRPFLAPLSGESTGDAHRVAVWVAKHYGGVVGHTPDRPLGTVTSVDHHSLVATYLIKYYGQGNGQGADGPLHTIVSKDRFGLVAAFLTKFYNSARKGKKGTPPPGAPLDAPAPVVTGQGQHAGLVTVELDGETWAIVDIGLRMLTPRELARCQGFEDEFKLVGTQAQQVARIGNSVSPPMARAVVAANVT